MIEIDTQSQNSRQKTKEPNHSNNNNNNEKKKKKNKLRRSRDKKRSPTFCTIPGHKIFNCKSNAFKKHTHTRSTLPPPPTSKKICTISAYVKVACTDTHTHTQWHHMQSNYNPHGILLLCSCLSDALWT